MNAITCGSESCDFTTVAELLATPLVQRYAGSEYTHMAYGMGLLWAYDSGRNVMCLIGRLKEPVRIPAQVSLAQDQ